MTWTSLGIESLEGCESLREEVGERARLRSLGYDWGFLPARCESIYQGLGLED